MKKTEHFPPKYRPIKEWLKITLEVSPIMTDAAVGFLSALTNSGVEIISRSEDSTPDAERIIGYLHKEKGNSLHDKIIQLQTFLTQMKQYFPDEVDPFFYTDSIIEEDWSRTWKRFFKTIRITPRIVIKPSWESYNSFKNKTIEDEIVIEMDPGLSFGTGHHNSTRLVLNIIDQLFAKKKSKTVLDVGTGTGILAMSCALLGASHVMAIDNDPDALAAAKKNVIRNNLENIVTVSDQEISTFQAHFDLITANIVHDVLCEMAPYLACMLDQGGKLVLSGILKGVQERSVSTVYGKQDLKLIESNFSKEWVALVFSKNA